MGDVATTQECPCQDRVGDSYYPRPSPTITHSLYPYIRREGRTHKRFGDSICEVRSSVIFIIFYHWQGDSIILGHTHVNVDHEKKRVGLARLNGLDLL
jgi:hypothetical protein